ncbi:MAG: hypothetical protein J6J37_06520 [Bacteroidaceae bacterium]|nr:hypothetical protein [Bacteroidaceae bacterium]
MRSIQTFILSLVFSLLCVNAFSRSSNDSILIPLEEIVNIEVGDNLNKKRCIDLISILPKVFIDSVSGNLYIKSDFATFDNVTYYIIDRNGSLLQQDEIFISTGVEIELPLTQLPIGSYRIVLKIEERFFGCLFDI